MEDRKLTREEIALQLLCAALSNIEHEGDVPMTMYDLLTKAADPDELGSVFHAADAFIQARDKA